VPQLAIALAVNTESIANSCVALTLFSSSNLSMNEAFSPSPQLAPVVVAMTSVARSGWTLVPLL